MKLGKEIAQIRKDHSMTQEAFGQLFHVTRQTVSNWENGKSYPDLETLVAISDHFGISLDMLLKEDAHMIQTIDKERRAGKRLFKSVIAVIGIIAIAFASYSGYWYHQKSSFEKQFAAAAKTYGFTPEIITDDDGSEFATGAYVAQNGNIEYSIIPPDFPTLLSFDTKIPDDAKFVVAECKSASETLRLRCAPTYTRDDAEDEIKWSETFTTLTLDKGMTENSDGTATPVLLPEYDLDNEGRPYAGHLDDETRAAYEAHKSDIEAAVTTLHEMLDAFYA